MLPAHIQTNSFLCNSFSFAMLLSTVICYSFLTCWNNYVLHGNEITIYFAKVLPSRKPEDPESTIWVFSESYVHVRNADGRGNLVVDRTQVTLWTISCVDCWCSVLIVSYHKMLPVVKDSWKYTTWHSRICEVSNMTVCFPSILSNAFLSVQTFVLHCATLFGCHQVCQC